MTDAELEAERVAILAKDHELAEAHERLHLPPDDREAHAAHRERLQAHADRLSAYSVALQQRTAHRSGRMCWTPLFPTGCPVCLSPSIVRIRRGEAYRCLEAEPSGSWARRPTRLPSQGPCERRDL